MTNRKRASKRSTGGKLHLPGRPRAVLRSQQVMFWQLIKQGVSSEEAGVQAGASAPVGGRWFREAGGMPPSKFENASQPLSSRYLCFAEREEIALYRAQGFGVCAIARKIGRSASTVSLELRRNAATRSRGFEYRRQQRDGMRIDQRAAPRDQSWLRTMHCGTMSKSGFQVISKAQTGTSWPVLTCLGRRDGLCADNIADGQRPGAQSRSPAVCLLIIRMTR